jgi:hypothetical protein
MLQSKPVSKSEQKRLAVQMAAFQKRQEKLTEQKSVPLVDRDPSLPICVIIDIDGTLSKRGDRGIFDFDKSIDDSFFHQIGYILRLIDDANRYTNEVVGKTHIFVITGREDKFSDVTNRWLNKHQIPFDKLFMRRTADRRPSNIVKEEIYAGNIRGRYNVLFVVDDRKQDVDMYRANGLYCLIADNSRE